MHQHLIHDINLTVVSLLLVLLWLLVVILMFLLLLIMAFRPSSCFSPYPFFWLLSPPTRETSAPAPSHLLGLLFLVQLLLLLLVLLILLLLLLMLIVMVDSWAWLIVD